MNTGSAAGRPSASAHCCHLPMRSGRGRALAGPRGHGSASARPGPSQPSRMGSDPRPASGARRQPPQEPTLAGAAAGRSGPLCAHPGIPGPHAALAGLCTAPTYGRGKRAPRCPGATSPVTPTVQQAAATPPPVRRLRLVLGPRLAPRQRPESVPTVHWSRPKGSATGAGHATPPHPGRRPSPACCPQGKRFTFSRLRPPPGVGQLSDSWLAPRRCGSTPDGL